jgi:translation initiation factor 3 subunit D
MPTGKKAQKRQKQYFAAMYGGGNKSWNRRQFREPSISIKSEWTTVEEYSKPHLDNIKPFMPGFTGIEAECGKVYPYLKGIDKAKPASGIILKEFTGDSAYVSTMDDDVMLRIAKENKADIFTTEIVISTLMACQKSVYSWDILVQKYKDKVFMDIRDEPNILDLLTVNETTSDKSPNDDQSENGVRALMIEAKGVNDSFQNLSLAKSEKPIELEEEDPFIEVEDQVAITQGYIYKIWNMGTRKVCVRCTRHTYVPNSWDALSEEERKERKENGESEPARSFMNVYSLLEYDNGKGQNWKSTMGKS